MESAFSYFVRNNWKDIRFSLKVGDDKVKNFKMNKCFRSCLGDFDGGIGFTQYNSDLVRVFKFEDNKIFEKVDGSYNIPDKWVFFADIVEFPKMNR